MVRPSDRQYLGAAREPAGPGTGAVWLARGIFAQVMEGQATG